MITLRILLAVIFLVLTGLTCWGWPSGPAVPEAPEPAADNPAQLQTRYAAWLRRHDALLPAASAPRVKAGEATR